MRKVLIALMLLFIFTSSTEGVVTTKQVSILFKPVKLLPSIMDFPRIGALQTLHTNIQAVKKLPAPKIKYVVSAVGKLPKAPVKPKPVVKPSVTANSGWRIAKTSSYGIRDGFLGKHMACGGPLLDGPPSKKTLTVAYRYLHTSRAELKCGDTIWLKYRNNAPILVTVTDAGPFVGGRLFDLAPATCRALGACGIPEVKWKKNN